MGLSEGKATFPDLPTTPLRAPLTRRTRPGLRGLFAGQERCAGPARSPVHQASLCPLAHLLRKTRNLPHTGHRGLNGNILV